MTGYEVHVWEDGGFLHKHKVYEEYEWDAALAFWLSYQGSSGYKASVTWIGEEYDDGRH